MKRRHTHVVSGLAASALVLTLAPMSATAGTSAAMPPEDKAASTARHDDLPNPLGDAQRELREDAVDKLMRGEARVVTKNGTQVIEITSDDAAETHAKAKGHQDNTTAAKGKGKGKGKGKRTKYVQYDVDREASIFTILTDFGDKTKPAQGGEAGPVHNEIPEHLRGTYAGLAHPAAVEHLLQLGVTAVELLPVHAHLDEPHLTASGLSNHWGYNTLGFFAPHADYAAGDDPQGVVDEFKGMVKLLHEAGI